MPTKKKSSGGKTKNVVNQAASTLGKRSAEVRKSMWGEKEFAKKLREWGKLGAEHGKKGGRPRKDGSTKKQSPK